jgi:cytochrome bd-type quinol oxidase subunit 1
MGVIFLPFGSVWAHFSPFAGVFFCLSLAFERFVFAFALGRLLSGTRLGQADRRRLGYLSAYLSATFSSLVHASSSSSLVHVLSHLF